MDRTIDAGIAPARPERAVARRPRRPGWLPAVVVGLSLSAAVPALAADADVTEPRGASAPALAAPGGFDLDGLAAQARALARRAGASYEATPPADRVTWGGLAAAAALGLGVVLERTWRLRHRRIVPEEFPTRFLERLQDGRLDRGKAQDYCELNPSPAARVALAAVKRWGRPVVDLDRAVLLAQRVEIERIRRNVGTLRRIAALAPLLGLLGTLMALSRVLGGLGATGSAPAAVWGPALAAALWPVTAGVALATLALVAYDGLTGKVEHLAGTLDRIGAETIDAIALALPAAPLSSLALAPDHRAGAAGPAQSHGPHPHTPAHPPLGTTRPGSHVRLEIPRSSPRPRIDDDDDLD